jgi:hypothetical protein
VDSTGVGDGVALAAVTPEPRSTASTAAAAAVAETRVREGRATERRDENMGLSHDARRRIDRGIVARRVDDPKSGRDAGAFLGESNALVPAIEMLRIG